MKENCEKILYQDKEIYLVKTAHVSKTSVDDVNAVIDEVKPDAICIELDEDRLESLNQKDRWRNMDIIEVIKQNRVGLLLVNVILSSFQRRMATQMNTSTGGEMVAGIKASEELYEERLSVCKECDMLLTGMCRSCGCYVELRAAVTKNYCPRKKW